MILPRWYFLKENEQLLVEGLTRRWTFNGPGTYFVSPLQRARIRKGITLAPTEYLRVRDQLTGQVRTETGPRLYFVAAHEEVGDKQAVIPLKDNQYVRLIDKRTGAIRVERGEQSIVPQPTEELLEGVKSGIAIDEEHAVLVRDTRTGQLSLITTPQIFIPTPTQEIVEVRERILLEDQQTVVVKDREGKYSFRRGSDPERAFFLEPYSELVRFRWSSGLHKDQKNLLLTHIDSRPKFMWYDFEVRTQDNVELVIGLTFFWQITDVVMMVRTTDDTTGDICSHARSMIIQAVSQVTLEKFLASFNEIAHDAVLGRDDPFYAERGVRIHAVEVRSIACKDPNTQRILQDIIQETTNRLNRLQKQESENEVQVKQLRGEIEAEEMRGQLLEKQREHKRLEALMRGEAEAAKVKALLDGLGEQLPPGDRLAIFNTLRKQDAIEALSTGKAQLYLTPSDMDLHIETRTQ